MSQTSAKPTDDGKLGMPILLRLLLGLGIILGWTLVIGGISFLFGVMSWSHAVMKNWSDAVDLAMLITSTITGVLSLGGGLIPGVLVFFDRMALALVAGQALMAATMVSVVVMLIIAFV